MNTKKFKSKPAEAELQPINWMDGLASPLWCLAMTFLTTGEHLRALRVCKALKAYGHRRQSWGPTCELRYWSGRMPPENAVLGFFARFDYPHFEILTLDSLPITDYLISDTIFQRNAFPGHLRLIDCRLRHFSDMPHVLPCHSLTLDPIGDCEDGPFPRASVNPLQNLTSLSVLFTGYDTCEHLGNLPNLTNLELRGDDGVEGALHSLVQESKVDKTKLKSMHVRGTDRIPREIFDMTSLEELALLYCAIPEWSYSSNTLLCETTTRRGERKSMPSVRRLDVTGLEVRYADYYDEDNAKARDDNPQARTDDNENIWQFLQLFPNIEELTASNFTKDELLHRVPLDIEMPTLKRMNVHKDRVPEDFNPFPNAVFHSM